MLAKKDSFFEDLFSRNFNKLQIYAVAQVHDRFVAEEVVQDPFLTALLRADLLREHEAPAACLMEILKNKTRQYKRDSGRRLRLFTSLESLPPNLAAANFFPLTMDMILQRVQDILSPSDWKLFQLRALEGYTHYQVAKELDITVWTSQKRMQRIRETLDEQFPEYRM